MRRVAIAILAYLRTNPEAKDSLDGISLWWVNEERDLVERSLSLLSELGAITKSRELYFLSDQVVYGEMQIEGLMKRL